MKSKIKLALVQMQHSSSSDENLDKAVAFIKKAADQHVDILCLSELFLSRYFCQTINDDFFKSAETIPGATTQKLAELAQKNKITIIASLFEKKDDKTFFNTSVVIDEKGQLQGKYRKHHIPDDPQHHYNETYYFKKGDSGFPVIQTSKAKIGVLICWDQWFPEAARSLALNGAEIIFYPTAIGWTEDEMKNEVGKNELDAWKTIQKSHAIANNIFVASCNRVGREDKMTFWGSSFVCDPIGKVLKESPSDKEDLLIVECDLNRILEVKKDWPFLENLRIDAYKNK